MSSTIKSKAQDLQLKRQMLQKPAQPDNLTPSNPISQLEKAKEVVQQSRSELRRTSNANAAVNHIVQNKKSNNDGDEAASIEENRLYTRQGRIEAESNETSKTREKFSSDGSPKLILEANDNPAAQATEVFRSVDEDNFYKVQDRGNEISENALGYYIDAYAPETEKDGIRVSILHNKAIVSGSRKAQNEVQEFDKKITTNNFQTFREEFAFDQPVVAEGMTRERDGDFIRFFIPKLSAKNDTNT